ncbi:MAG: hypothetical protein RJB55_386 [Verrucomicrobiota bacterium]
MSRLQCALAFILLIAGNAARAAYAPVPESDEGKDLIVKVRASVGHDSNLFGAATGAIETAVYTLAPGITWNRSLTEQTFFSAAYGLTLDRFDRRPGDKFLDSHDATLRLAHAFSQATVIDLNNAFMIARNPESLLAGVKVNADQSFLRNQFDGRFTTPLAPKVTGTVKARSALYEYRDRDLGRALDRTENLLGLAADYAVLPEMKAVAEYRHQDIWYTKLGETKNKRSDYLMVGADHELARKLTLSGRAGLEWRSRRSERSATAPYAEFSGRYAYAPRSFLLGGLGYSLEETSDTARFNDSRALRAFATVQHAVSALIVASVSVSLEPSSLQGRRGQADVDETTVRSGVSLTYLPGPGWMISGSLDVDRSDSDDPARNLRRTRISLGATRSF